MDLTEMLDELALDLNITLGTEVSIAEGTRAINKSVDALSRKIPRERIYEYTWVKAVTDNSFTTPALADTDMLVDAMDLPDTVVDGSLATLTAAIWLDVPRPVIMTLTDASNAVTRMTLVVKGTDVDGIYVEERFYRRNGKIQIGKVYFFSIYEIEFSEIAKNVTGITLDVGTTDGTNTWVNLSNPIEPKSESIYSATGKGGTKYTRDTDYYMDYANGKIQIISGGSMVEATTYYANYSRSAVSIDISDIIPYLQRIIKVIYPVDKVPQQEVTHTIWDNLLTITTLRQGVGQEAFGDKEHLAIFYEARQAPPTLVGSGSYPELLDEIVLIGAAGYALESEALQHEHLAVADLASMRLELTLTTAVHALITTALGKAAVLLTATTGKIDIALSKAAVIVTASSGKIDLALTKVALYLETNDTTDNAKDVLANITDDVADLRTKVNAAVDAVATALGLIDTKSLDKATTGAEGYLDTGDGLINQLNDGGERVPVHYADYSKTRVQIAAVRAQQSLAYVQEAQTRLNNLQTYVTESMAWMHMGEVFTGEAQTLIAEVNAIVGEAMALIAQVNGAVSEAGARLGQIDRYLAEAESFRTASEGSMLLSDRYRSEAILRLQEFNRLLDSKSEYRKRIMSAAVRQPA